MTRRYNAGNSVRNKPLNEGMPDKRKDKKAYEKERYRRMKEGTWVKRPPEKGCGYATSRRQVCDCDLCKAYDRGYSAGRRARRDPDLSRRAIERPLYADDPFMQELLP